MEKIMPKNLKDIQAWAPADTEIAVRLWKEGKSAREIGRRLSRTRNAIIGKIHRLGLCRKDQAKTTPTIAGKIGVKCWICKKPEKLPEPRSAAPSPTSAQAPAEAVA